MDNTPFIVLFYFNRCSINGLRMSNSCTGNVLFPKCLCSYVGVMCVCVCLCVCWCAMCTLLECVGMYCGRTDGGCVTLKGEGNGHVFA